MIGNETELITVPFSSFEVMTKLLYENRSYLHYNNNVDIDQSRRKVNGLLGKFNDNAGQEKLKVLIDW